MQLFLGVTEINLHHFYGVVQFGGENWGTKNENILGGSNHSTVIFWGLKFQVCDFGG